MNLWTRFKNLPGPLLMLHVTAKFLGGVALGALLGRYLEPYGWWILIAAFVIAIPSAYRILTGKAPAREATPR